MVPQLTRSYTTGWDSTLATTWAGYAQATLSNNRAAVASYMTPSAFEAAEGTLDCGCTEGPLTYSTTTFSVPPQTTYPLSFLAGLNGRSYSQLSITWWVVFTKASSSAPWLIAFLGSFEEGGGLTGFPPYATASPLSVPNTLAAAPQAFAAFFQELDSTGNEGSGTPANYVQDNILNTEIQNSQSSYAQTPPGLTKQYTHSIDAVSPVFAQVVNGSVYGAEECFAMHVTEVVKPTDGSPIVQPEDQSTWGYQIPPGSFSELSFTTESENCVAEDSGGGITLNANFGGAYSSVAIPS
jgi:hypothetical protein